MHRTLHHTLFALEQRLLDPAMRTDRAAISFLLAEEFHEVGKSGRLYDRAVILDRLSAESSHLGPPPHVTFESFEATLLGPEAALAVYISVHGKTRVHRVSVWVYRDGRWQMLHHQGTPSAEPA